MPEDFSAQNLRDRIDRLQQRQFQLVRESAEELAFLRLELERQQNSTNSEQDLNQQIEDLRTRLESANKEKDLQTASVTMLQQQFFSYYSKNQTAYEMLRMGLQLVETDNALEPATPLPRAVRKNPVYLDSLRPREPNAAPPKVRPHDIVEIEVLTAPPPTQTIQKKPLIKEKQPEKKTWIFRRKKEGPPQNVPVQKVVQVAKPAKIVEPSLPAAVIPPKKKPRKVKRLIRRTLSLGIVVGLLYGGWQKIAHSTIGLPSTGQVAGVSTDSQIAAQAAKNSAQSSATDSIDSHPEIYATIKFEDTMWEKTTNPAFNIKFLYPKNASALIYTPGSSNLWIARDKGFLAKFTRFDNSMSLDEWMAENKLLYKDDYSLSKGTFKGMPSWIGTTSQVSDTSGTINFIKYRDSVYSIWTLNADPGSLKGRWISHITDSIEFFSL
jgi:hypothetical protein